MSTRRSTRAASSRASSVAASDAAAFTPRRSTRGIKGLNQPLPGLNPRESTSYGSSITAVPVAIRRRGREHDLTGNLGDILGGVQEEEGGAGGGSDPQGSVLGNTGKGGGPNGGSRPRPVSGRVGKAPSASSTAVLDLSVTFGGESGIFGEAVVNAGGLDAAYAGEQEAEEQPLGVPFVAGEGAPFTAGPRLVLQRGYNFVVASLAEVGRLLLNFYLLLLRWIFANPCLLVLLLLSATLVGVFNLGGFGIAPAGRQIRSTLTNIQHSLGEYIPYPVAHPERDLSWLGGRIDRTDAAISQLERILPTALLVKRDDSGNIEIPVDFWAAIKRKVVSDNIAFKGAGEISDGGSHTVAAGSWAEFLAQNEAKMKAWQKNQIDARLREISKDSSIMSKEDILKAIETSFNRNIDPIRVNIGKIQKHMHDQKSALTEEQVKSVMRDYLPQFRGGALNLAHAEAMLQLHAEQSYLRVNHFSPGLGAIISPRLTSPTYQYSKQRAGFMKRAVLRVIGNPLPPPKSPAEALTKWDEVGDCWCAPSVGTGAGAQLGVLLTNSIFPDQISVEHIPPTATLDSGATPKQIEVLAKIADWDKRLPVLEHSADLFPSAPEEQDLDESWVLIGVFTYDLNNHNHVQLFSTQLDLKRFGISTRQIVVRARNNWGSDDHTCFYRVRLHGTVDTKAT